ncbi:MAG: DNA polymerase III, subunit gamma and tau [Candidatus Buchananbacteria bacterium RIFCSPHIGHO2_01_FULL_39_14]|uniref:DNA polymerase III subunit gamma/tau n=2 Tax=Candidatus Buchananiibacteriota TaxID=1817903 RepID=A0A1G1YS45_9BACT|nr:MAG: DNA polymerase III, subunit gamma and tau [Candidatus Buchananbacteria bacterium RIFCSPHIGHO2_01_FULL_39_14]OGY48492.1 MAG: DNA polymerase III, subunit gamma and tau [Candidatus Buchananbacteria bacterium RIFCSPHIGHO2_02_FULL_39_17]OGY54247.1 MAG: DNA polymerase III, subunit gamma and tau [Candidatus Buchananbacteria bacterium RIFCSPLOWO2_01_FULL_40_23b]
MSQTLYRKYRPQTFSELVGQNHIKTTLQSELETEKIAHAYLFSGPRGLGKTTVARLLAKSVNCLNRKAGKSEPCNDCVACQEIIVGRSLDVLEIDAASHTGVDNVRENIINSSRFTPTSRKFKVFIIDEVHMLSLFAFNALLKTLEEPPAYVIFILATTEIHKVPQTIISRCQHFEFRKINKEEIIKRLNHLVTQEGKKVDELILENIANVSGGCLRDAESLLGQILTLDEKKITLEQSELVLPRSRFDLVLELINYLNIKDTAGALTLINNLVEEGVNLEKFTNDLIEALRKILLLKINKNLIKFSGNLDKESEKKISQTAQNFDLEYLVKIIEILVAKKVELKFAEIQQLPLELAVIEIIESKKESDDKFNPPAPRATKGEEQKKVEPPPESETKKTGRISLTLENIKERWQEVLTGLREHNQSLASTLKICQPKEVTHDGFLEICLQHKFHQQRLNDLKNKKLLEKILAEIFGVELIVRTVIVKDIDLGSWSSENVVNQDNQGLNDIIKTFGGQVVE